MRQRCNMLNFLIRQFKRFGLAAAIILAGATLLITLSLSALYVYNIPSAVAIRMVPRSLRRAIEEFILTAQNLPYLQYALVPSKLPVYEVTLDPGKLEEIYKSLPKEDVGMLPDEAKDSKQASLKVGGQTYSARLGVHGDTSLHWLYEKKSWQIKVEGENTPDGMREMMFIVPIRRYFVLEQFNNYRAKKLGLFVPESKFANLKINGRNMGAYFLTEGWSEDLLASAGVAMPTNLYGERAINEPVFDGVEFWKKYTRNSEQKFDDYGELRRLLDLIRSADDETFRKNIFTLIDEENFYDWYIHALLSGSTHQDWAHNLRIYFDRSSGKLKFIPWDVGAWSTEGFSVDSNYNPLISRVIAIPEFKLKRDKLLYKYVADPYNLEDDLAAYDKAAAEARAAFYKDPLKEYSNKYYDDEVARYREIVKNNFSSIRNYLERAEFAAEVFIEPAPGMAAIADLIMANPVPLKIENISASSTIVIEDSNRNGRLDPADRIAPKDKILYPKLTPSNPDVRAYMPFNFVPEKYRFFLLPSGAKVSDLKISVSAKNVITGAPAAVSPKFFSGIPLREISY